MKTIILIIIIALLLFSKKIKKQLPIATFKNKTDTEFKYNQNSNNLITIPTIDETNNDNFIKDTHREMLGEVNEEISKERLDLMQGYNPELEDNVDFKYTEPDFMRMAQPYFTL